MNTALVGESTENDAPRLSIHLLVVDDDDVDRERVLRLLTGSNLNVQAMEAATGADALRMVREHEFDCVMLDNQLGPTSGAELLPVLHRESLRACPIIMITGAGNETLAVQVLRNGAADYLPKFQLSSDILARAIHRALEHQQMRLEIKALQMRLQQRVDVQAMQLVERERDLRAILNHTPSVIGYWDDKLRNRFGNRAHQGWLGINPRALPGRHLRDVIGPLNFERNEVRINAVLHGKAQAFEYEFIAAGGATRHVQFSLRPDLDDAGAVRGFYATATDVTAIRQAQSHAAELARFAEAVIDNDPVGCGVYRIDGHCVMSNGALERALGADAPRLKTLGLWAWVEQRATAMAAPAWATMEDGRARRCEVVLGGNLDGNQDGDAVRVRLDCRLARILREGQPHLLVFADDITEQHKVLEALVAARDLAEVAAHTKSAFLANMSHEIRTPMNAIVGLSRLALEDALPAGARDDLDKVHTAAVALMRLLDDVLDYSKIEAGQLRFEQLGFNLEQTLQRTVDIFAVRIGQKGLVFVVDLPPELPLQLVGDALRLSQVLNNLVGNAVKFTEKGHVHLMVRELPDAQPERCLLRFSVHDCGIGIDPAQHASLFKAFMQADGSITRRFGGTGLGLAICQRLVEMMGGAMGMKSVPGHGSEFWFTANLLRAGAPRGSLLRQPSVASLRVLLLGDGSLADRVNLAQLLAWEVRVTRAAEASAALRQVEQGRRAGDPYDVVLFDGQLLTEDEQRVLAHSLRRVVNRAAVGSPALVVMSSIRKAADDASPDLQPDAVLAKPVLASPLLAVLQKIAARRDTQGLAHTAGTGVAGSSRAATQAACLLARAAPLAGARVLLAEDNVVNQIVARRILERMGLEVHVVGDGAQALAALEAVTGRSFDAVLMDLHMPVMDGLEATRRIREREAWAALPVIAMTAAVLPEDRAHCFEAGMVDHVAKPLIPEGVLDTLLRWIPAAEHSRPVPAPQAPNAVSHAPARGPDPDIPGLDLGALRMRVLGDEVLVWRLLSKFVVLEQGTGAHLLALLMQADDDGLRSSAHGLRGAAASMGLDGVAGACATLETALRTNAPLDAPTRRLAAVLDAVLGELRVAIERREAAAKG
jgi:two-component system, sensor histidine kinase and response regulator